MILNCLEIRSIMASKMTSKSTLKTYSRLAIRPLGTPLGDLGDFLGSKVTKLMIVEVELITLGILFESLIFVHEISEFKSWRTAIGGPLSLV